MNNVKVKVVLQKGEEFTFNDTRTMEELEVAFANEKTIKFGSIPFNTNAIAYLKEVK